MLLPRVSTELLLLGGLTIGARALDWPQNIDVDSFIARERQIALQGALNNIGPNGTEVPGAAAGAVVASPSKEDPNYFYTWTRDAALTLKMIVDEFLRGNKDLQVYIEDYIHFQAVLQTVTNPSGALLPTGSGLGEPKYMVDGSRFNGAWGRPQRDGPALRAISIIDYSNFLIERGDSQRVKEIIWPIISNDLSYVGQYWNSTGFDLWEEVSGSSFFTSQSQYRALVQGATLAAKLGVTCTGCDQAPQILCFLQSYWNSRYLTANINVDNGRTGVDANTVLGALVAFDVEAPCDGPLLQPCNSRSLANFKVFVDTFRNASLYPINAGVPPTRGVALGRYPEDVYYDGNPWYLITVGAAEFLYDTVAQWSTQGYVAVHDTSLAFFRDLYPAAEAGAVYRRCRKSDPYRKILDAATTYADSFVAVAQRYTPHNGSLSEQFLKSPPGTPLSARDLTWSYAAFVTMAQRRAGYHPGAGWWARSAATKAPLPAVCEASSTRGVYAPAVGAGAPNVTSGCASGVLFEVNATTYYGENVYLVGNVSALGDWDVENSQPLSASNYTASRPEWFAQVALPAGEVISYTYVRQEDCGQPWIWETRNRTLRVPACVEGGDEQALLTTDDAWEGPVGSSGHC